MEAKEFPGTSCVILQCHSLLTSEQITNIKESFSPVKVVIVMPPLHVAAIVSGDGGDKEVPKPSRWVRIKQGLKEWFT